MVKTTSKVGGKQYRCAHCGHEHRVSTNHYGEIYSPCPNDQCISRRPNINATYRPPHHVCLEAVPEGTEKPAPWTVATLGDLVEIVEVER